MKKKLLLYEKPIDLIWRVKLKIVIVIVIFIVNIVFIIVNKFEKKNYYYWRKTIKIWFEE